MGRKKKDITTTLKGKALIEHYKKFFKKMGER